MDCDEACLLHRILCLNKLLFFTYSSTIVQKTSHIHSSNIVQNFKVWAVTSPAQQTITRTKDTVCAHVWCELWGLPFGSGHDDALWFAFVQASPTHNTRRPTLSAWWSATSELCRHEHHTKTPNMTPCDRPHTLQHVPSCLHCRISKMLFYKRFTDILWIT